MAAIQIEGEKKNSKKQETNHSKAQCPKGNSLQKWVS